jgi:NADH:ubiquinone oxidoreductase subunit F (NADH-binding)
VKQVLERILEGNGVPEDLDLLQDVCENIATTSFCGLGEASVNAILSTMEKFREDYNYHIKGPQEVDYDRETPEERST